MSHIEKGLNVMRTARKVVFQISILGRQWSDKKQDIAFVVGLFASAIFYARNIADSEDDFKAIDRAANLLADQLDAEIFNEQEDQEI